MGHMGFRPLLLLTAHNFQALNHLMAALNTRAISRHSNRTFPLTRVLYNHTRNIVSIHRKEASLDILGVSHAIEMMCRLLLLLLNLGLRNYSLLTGRRDLSAPVARLSGDQLTPSPGLSLLRSLLEKK